MEEKLIRVSGKSHRDDKQKRSIEIIGDLISDLFGNPGPSDYKKTTANILALQSAMKRLNDNSETLHTDIDTSRHNIELNNVEIRSLSGSLIRNQATLTTVTEEITSLKMYFEISQLADAVENQINYLVEVKADSLKGFCNDRAINRDFLVENLHSMEANEVGLSPIFSSWDWRDYYKHDMCTTTLDRNTVWITLRIPQVKKAERLVRVIPVPALRESLVKVESYGLDVVLFREKNNDKFHAMTTSSLDFCTNLGKMKSCSVRDARFVMTKDVVIPIEFALNRFLLVSLEPVSMKLVGRCPSGMVEHTLTTDTVMLVPVNCSYIGKQLSIDERTSDSNIIKEIGIIHFDKLDISPVSNLHKNYTEMTFARISNATSNSNFEKNRKMIDDQLRAIDTKHESSWTQYSTERWGFVGCTCLLGLAFIIHKILPCCIPKKNSTTVELELPVRNTLTVLSVDADTETSRQQQQQQQQPIEQQQQRQTTKQMTIQETHETFKQQQQPLQQQPQLEQQQQRQATKQITYGSSNAEHVYTEVSDGSVSFGLPTEQSQFYQKRTK